MRATTARGGHERGGRGVIAALPTRRGRSGKNPRTMIDGPRPPPRGHPSPGSACRRPFLALAANVNPAAPPPCREPGVLRAYASIERDGWRARIERPPAGVCVEDARAILCRGGRGQTVAECSPPAIRSSSSGGRRAGAGGVVAKRENELFRTRPYDKSVIQTHVSHLPDYICIWDPSHIGSAGTIGQACSYPARGTVLSAHDGRCSRHPRLPDLRPPRGDPLAPRRRGSHARRARGFRPRLRRGTPGTTRRSPSSLEEAMFSMRTDDRPARVVRRPSSLTPDRPLHHHEHRSRPRRPAAKSRSRRSPR